MNKGKKAVTDKVRARNAELAGLVTAGMPVASARASVGLSPRTHNLPPAVRETIAQMREGLQSDPKYGFKPTLQRVYRRAVNRNVPYTDQNTADKLLAKIMGFEAPLQMQLEQRSEINTAILIFSQIAQRSQLTPEALKQSILSRSSTTTYTIMGNSGDSMQDKAVTTDKESVDVPGNAGQVTHG